jgi:hypothetical protein
MMEDRGYKIISSRSIAYSLRLTASGSSDTLAQRSTNSAFEWRKLLIDRRPDVDFPIVERIATATKRRRV